eukprot:jgi/Antlo1/930/2446
MGVPSLFRYITDKYPDTIRPVTSEDKTDMLYIDFNAIVHRCCKHPMAPPPKDENEIFLNVQAYLCNIVELVEPRILVYIATDGVAPRAKLNQQRARRYHSSVEAALERSFVTKPALETDAQEELEVSKEEAAFESNAITPGTDFMKRLDDFINDFIKYQVTYEWKHLSVIYSSSNVSGEGEQKILEFIRSQKNFAEFSHTIYSPDADIIFLGLSLHKLKVRLMRNDQNLESRQKKEFCKTCQKKGHSAYYCGNIKTWRYLYFDIEILKRHLYSMFKSHIKRKFSFHRIVDDWVFLCFLAGNDFIPNLQCLDIRFGALEHIFFILTYNFNSTGLHITENGNINASAFKNAMALLAKHENTFYYKKLESLREARRKFFNKVPVEEIWLHTAAGKSKYYEEKLGATTEEDVKIVCRDYLECLSWILSYYYTGIKSWDFYYPHHYSPFAKDLIKVSNLDFSFVLGKPLRPLEQLMAVMPPLSKELIPAPMQVLFKEFQKFYPEDVQIDMFDRLLAWQGVALLPFLDIKTMLPRIRETVESMELCDMYKNIKGQTLLYLSESNRSFSTLYTLYIDARNSVVFDNKSFSGRIYQYYGAIFPGNKSVFFREEYENKTISVIFENVK